MYLIDNYRLFYYDVRGLVNELLLEFLYSHDKVLTNLYIQYSIKQVELNARIKNQNENL